MTMKAVDTLLRSTTDLKVGNHSVQHLSNCTKYFYFDTPICIEYPDSTILVQDGGFSTNPSTTRAINEYLKYYEGYEVTDLRKLDHNECYYDPEYDMVVDNSRILSQFEVFSQQRWFNHTFEQFRERNFVPCSPESEVE